MLGAITGDIVGSIYEWHNIKTKEFDLFAPHRGKKTFFTDDSVLTVALADSILTGTDYAANLKTFYRHYPHAGYGASFHAWAQTADAEPYNSWGNGAAMIKVEQPVTRLSPHKSRRAELPLPKLFKTARFAHAQRFLDS